MINIGNGLRRDYLLIVIISAILGALLVSQYTLFQYFYNSKGSDLAVMILFSIAGGILSHLFFKPSSITLHVFTLVFIVVAALTKPIAYSTFHVVDLVSVITYFTAFYGTAVIINHLRKNKLNHYFIALLSAFISGYSQHHFPKAPLLFALCILGTGVYSYVFIITKYFKTGIIAILIFISQIGLFASTFYNFPLFERQQSYYDKVVFSYETPFQHIDITEWRGNNWFYYNNINQFSTIDEWLYFEPLVHPVVALARQHNNVLVIGGENGLAIKELIKYKTIEKIDHIVLDTALLNLAKSHHLFTSINHNVLDGEIVNSINKNAFRFLDNHRDFYDVIVIDIPDPVDIELNQYYTAEFYKLCYQSLSENGMLVTQAGSPYYATLAYYCISNTVRAANFGILELHNQVLTLGEWGWIIGSKNNSESTLREMAAQLQFDGIDTKWLNNEAMNMMMSFGKTHLLQDSIEVNTIKNPIVHKLYTKGTWKF